VGWRREKRSGHIRAWPTVWYIPAKKEKYL
jgi:hypothetical protein